ncbi:MAG: hypothetical protein RSA66_06120 [Muribaculaceae bacterium]
MFEIWREKIERLKVVRSGALHQSFNGDLDFASTGSTIKMKFLAYGIFQAAGVGNGYVSKNGGDLPFLGENYRKDHGLNIPRKVGPAWGGYLTSGKIRKPRDWFNPKLYGSVMVLKETMAHMCGEQASAIICDALHDSHGAL